MPPAPRLDRPRQTGVLTPKAQARSLLGSEPGRKTRIPIQTEEIARPWHNAGARGLGLDYGEGCEQPYHRGFVDQFGFVRGLRAISADLGAAILLIPGGADHPVLLEAIKYRAC